MSLVFRWTKSHVCPYCEVGWPAEERYFICPRCREGTNFSAKEPTLTPEQAITASREAAFGWWLWEQDRA